MIERKKKKCKTCEQMKYIFSKGECKSCASIRYQKKALENRKNKEAKKPKSVIKPTAKYKEAKSAERIAMQTHWNLKADELGCCYCAECSKNLGSEFNPYNMAHIISKGANKSLQANVDNFIILCAEHHNQFDNGSRESMKVYKQTEIIREKLKSIDSKNFK